MFSNPQARQKFCEILAQNLRSGGVAKVCALGGLFLLAPDALANFYREDPAAFMKFVTFSPDPTVRENGIKVALQEGLDIEKYICENGPLFVEQVLEMSSPFAADGYGLLMEHNLGVIFLENADDAFMEYILKSSDIEAIMMGISFILQNGLMQKFLEKYGEQILCHILSPNAIPIMLPLWREIMMPHNVMIDRLSDLFAEISKSSLPKCPYPQARAIGQFSDVFGMKIDGNQGRQFHFSFPPLNKAAADRIEKEKILIASSDILIDDSYAHQILGTSLMGMANFPFRQLCACKHSSALICKGQKENLTQCESDRLEKTKTQIATFEAAHFEDGNFDIAVFARNILCSSSSETRRRGYVFLKDKFSEQAKLKEALSSAGLVNFCPFLSMAVDGYLGNADGLLLKFTPYATKKECEGVCGDALEFFKQNGILDDMMRAPVKEMNGIPFAMLLLTSPAANQRMMGYDFIRNDDIDLTTPENFKFFVHMVLNSDNKEIRDAGIGFLKDKGIEHVQINGVIYKFEPY
jgi:hypothetical protein